MKKMQTSKKKPLASYGSHLTSEDIMWLESTDGVSRDMQRSAASLIPMNILVSSPDLGKKSVGWELYDSDGKTVMASGVEKTFNAAFSTAVSMWHQIK